MSLLLFGRINILSHHPTFRVSVVRNIEMEKPRKSSNILSQLPKFLFSQASTNVSEQSRESLSITGVVPGSFKQEVNFKIDKDGNLDLGTVPEEFQQMVKQLWDRVKEPKYCIGTEDDSPVQCRKGPRIEKNMKDEEILLLMRSLVNTGNIWDNYTKVRQLKSQ